MEFLLFKQILFSFLLGLLVGIQREKMRVRLGGMRTFPLICVFGTVCAFLAHEFGSWVLLGGFLSLALVCVVPHLTQLVLYMVQAHEPTPTNPDRPDLDKADEQLVLPPTDDSFQPIDPKDRDFGITTLMAAMLMFGVGALITVEGMLPVAVIIGGAVAILLQFKIELHSVLDRLKDSDMKAIMQFVLISCVILPILPNRTFGPYDAFNPFEAWLMVVLIVGMSLGGYIVYMFLGQNAGIFLGGFLGGAISSTATTISYSKRAQLAPSTRTVSAIVIMIASTVVFIRVLVEIAIVSPRFLAVAAGPVCTLMVLTFIPAVLLWLGVSKAPPPMPDQKNPTQLKSAFMFGAIYSLVKFALAVAKVHAGPAGMLVVAALSGLTDMDAITLSTARMAEADIAAGDAAQYMSTGWRMILIAAVSNLFFKSLIVASIADRKFFWMIVRLFLIPFIGGIAIIFLWP